MAEKSSSTNITEGPVPTIERLLNSSRVNAHQKPVPFLLTDIKPHVDSWMKAAAKSDHLSFIPQKVDATDPPVSVTSTSSHAPGDTAETRFFSDTRIFRLYCLAFHHFDDQMARKVLQSTFDTADGFAIIELQDRRLGSLLLMVLDLFLILIASIFWFWKYPLHLVFTYLIPILPAIMTFDGLVSSLRTREFGEVMSLVDDVLGGATADRSTIESIERDGQTVHVVRRGGWVFEGSSQMHTWPIGYLNWVVGYKIPPETTEQSP
jgi:hypothetical protein